LPEDVLADVEVREGWLALRHGDLGTATRLLERSVPIAEAATDGLIDRRWFATYMAALAMTTGQHEKADALLQQRMRLRVQAGDGRTPFAAYDWVQLSQNALMKGDFARAESALIGAPDFAPLGGDVQSGGTNYSRAIQEQRVRIHLHRGEVAVALQRLPAPYGLDPVEDRSDPTLAPYALRGEVLCAAGRPAEGLPYLEASISAMAPALTSTAPGLARLRAVAGLCALSLGDTLSARTAARLSRAAFLAQPGVSPWFKLPSTRLAAALSRHAGRR